MSGPTEGMLPPDIIFEGIDGSECEAFVVAIRDFAFATGRDSRWMFGFAATRLRGKALRWHAKLDLSIQSDWHLFVQALFNQYPLVEEADEAEIATPVWSTTTFSPGPSTATLPLNLEANQSLTGVSIFHNAQAEQALSHSPYGSNVRTSPARQYDTSCTGLQIGFLRIIGIDVEGTSIPRYVWWDYDESNYKPRSTMTTLNRHEALVVCFLPSSTPHAIGCMNSRARFKSLTLSWNSDPAKEFYHVCGCTYGDNTVTPTANASGLVLKPWNLLADGTLQASLSSFSKTQRDGGYEETKFITTEVQVNTMGDDIRFVKSGTVLPQDKHGSKVTHPFVRARIVFEPL